MLRSKVSKGDVSLNLSTLNCSSLTQQSLAQTMQRQIDNYTRRLQQDKRKYFRAQQNFQQMRKQYETKNKQLQKLKSKKHKTQLMLLKGKINTLEGTLDQTINSYNQSLAKNNKLKLEIDQVRKEKKNDIEKLKFLVEKMQTCTIDMEQKKAEVQRKKQNVQKIKQQIIKIREMNEIDTKAYQKQVNLLKQEFQQSALQNSRHKAETNSKSESIDTQPIVKLRLRNIVTQNKQKIKIMDQYKKNMNLIYQNFEQIKEESGIQNLDQITKTFLKHEEQNLFIYQYISRLNTQIEQLTDGNQQIRKNIERQEQINKERRLYFTGTPQDAQKKRKLQQVSQQKCLKIAQLQNFLLTITPHLTQVFTQYSIQSTPLQLSSNNIQSYLALLQTLINNQLPCIQLGQPQFKEDMTRYTRVAPNLNQELKEKVQERLMEKERLNQFAGEFWDRKRANRNDKAQKIQKNDKPRMQITQEF